jgi:molybdopterin-containing oxidoreductase family iron-sulfur binding subunit
MSSNKKILEKCWRTRQNSSIVEALRNNEFVEEIPTDEF